MNSAFDQILIRIDDRNKMKSVSAKYSVP